MGLKAMRKKGHSPSKHIWSKFTVAHTHTYTNTDNFFLPLQVHAERVQVGGLNMSQGFLLPIWCQAHCPQHNNID